MRRLKNAWPTRFISAVPPYFADDVLHRVAGADVVDDLRARVLEQERLGQQRRDEVAGDELAAAVDEEAAVGVAVPRDADVRLLLDHALDDVAAVLLDERVGFVVRERAVHLEAQRASSGRAGARTAAARPGRPCRCRRRATTLNGLIDRRIDERHHVLDVVVDARRCVETVPGVARRRRQRAAGDHVADVADARVAAERERLRRTILMPLYSFGIVRRGDLRRRRRARRARRRSTSCRCATCRSRRRRRPARARRR